MNSRDLVLYSYLKGKGGGGGGGELELKNVSLNCTLLDYTSSTIRQLTADLYVEQGDFVIFVLMARSNITQYPSECSLLFASESASPASGGGDGQFVSVYTMNVQTSGMFKGTFMQRTANRMALVYAVFKNLTSATHSGYYTKLYSTWGTSFDAVDKKKENDKLLWIVSMNAWDNSTYDAEQVTTPNDLIQFSYGSGRGDKGPRLAVYWDDGTGALQRNFSKTGTETTACIIDAVEIE